MFLSDLACVAYTTTRSSSLSLDHATSIWLLSQYPTPRCRPKKVGVTCKDCLAPSPEHSACHSPRSNLGVSSRKTVLGHSYLVIFPHCSYYTLLQVLCPSMFMTQLPGYCRNCYPANWIRGRGQRVDFFLQGPACTRDCGNKHVLCVCTACRCTGPHYEDAEAQEMCKRTGSTVCSKHLCQGHAAG